MANPIQESTLKSIVKKDLKRFNDENVEINDDTVLGSVLSTSDGYGPSNSANIVRGAIRWTFKNRGLKDPKIPKDWLSLSVKDFVSKLLAMLVLITMSFSAQSQLKVSLAATKTELKNSAITVGISYIRSLDSAWREQDFLIGGKNSFFLITPQIDIETGTQDAFSSISAKVSGLFTTFKTTTVDDVVTPDLDKAFNTFPISLGIETNNLFSYVNGIAEIGWVPWYQSAGSSEFLKHTKFGLFVQGGYKFYVDTTQGIGGQKDESLEKIRSSIFRAKGSVGIATGAIIKLGAFRLGLAGDADGWYDIKNGKVYHRLQASGRFYLAPEYYFDFIYQNGSGAPNFNTGNQWGTKLTVTF